jgi:hypothetical protein
MALLNSKHELIYHPTSIPSWTCGNCRQGTLIESQERVRHEPQNSIDAKKHEAWEPEWTREYFAIFYDCPQCCVGSVASGQVHPTQDYDPATHGSRWYSCYDFQSFTVAPAIVRVEAEIPDDVEARLQEAFGHYWTDSNACGNAMRRCVEIVLDEKKVKKKTVNKHNKRVDISTHDRIDHHLKPNMIGAKGYLMALKWGGNSGSHGSIKSHTKDELLDMFELLEGALVEIYGENQRKVLTKKAAMITSRKGRPAIAKRRPRRKT